MYNSKLILKEAGFKVTLSRIRVLDALHRPDCKHITAEGLYKKLLELGNKVSLASIYQILTQFERGNIVKRHSFGGEKSVFELAVNGEHDHLFCSSCGKAYEFVDVEIIEKLKLIAECHGIDLQSHTLQLHGKCIGGCKS